MSINSHFPTNAEPRKRPRQARSQALVERILDEAARLFAERGYHATTTNHVAAAAEVSVGSLYQYFPNKDALIVGLLDRHLDVAIPRLTTLVDQLADQDLEVEELCRAFVDVAAELNEPQSLHVLLRSAPVTPAIAERFAALQTVLIDEVERRLVDLGHPHDRARLRATVLVEAVDAVVHSDVRDDRPGLLDELVRLCALSVSSR